MTLVALETLVNFKDVDIDLFDRFLNIFVSFWINLSCSKLLVTTTRDNPLMLTASWIEFQVIKKYT